MSSLVLKNSCRFGPKEMVTTAKPRCGHSQLLLDRRMAELLVLNASSLEVDSVIKYPIDCEEFEIHDWVVTLDGKFCYLFSNEPRDYFLSIDLDNSQTDKIWYTPEFGDTYLCWLLPTGLFLGRDNTAWMIEENRLVLASQAARQMLFPAQLRQAIEKGYAIEKIGNDGVAYVRGPANESIGKVSAAGQLFLMQQDGKARDVTSEGDRLFVSFQDEVVDYSDKRRRSLLQAMDALSLNSINVISSSSEKLLSVLGWEEDDTVLWNYHLID